jgi:hypothetical protein
VIRRVTLVLLRNQTGLRGMVNVRPRSHRRGHVQSFFLQSSYGLSSNWYGRVAFCRVIVKGRQQPLFQHRCITFLLAPFGQPLYIQSVYSGGIDKLGRYVIVRLYPPVV